MGLYDTYLSRFDKEPRAYEVQFAVGEISFFRLEKYLDAATHYMAAAKGIPAAEKTGPLADMRHDALYNTLVALSREMDVKRERDKKSGETEADKKYAEALDLYAQYYPNDPQLPAMFYRQGKYYFENANYDSAVKIWGMLLEKFPTSEQARDAGDSILESFSRAKNYENIETWARRLKALSAFSTAKQQERLDALIVQAVFKQGEQKAAAGDHGAAAAAYLRAAKEFPKDARAAQACVSTPRKQEAKLAGDAKTLAGGGDPRDGPGGTATGPESPSGAWIATTTLQAMGLLRRGGRPRRADGEPGRSRAPELREVRTRARRRVQRGGPCAPLRGENDRAVVDGNKFLSAYASSAEADEVACSRMGRAHQNAGHAKDAAELYKRYITRAKNLDHRAQGLVLLAQADAKIGDDHGAEIALDEAVTLGKRRARELNAYEGKYDAPPTRGTWRASASSRSSSRSRSRAT